MVNKMIKITIEKRLKKKPSSSSSMLAYQISDFQKQIE